MGDGENRTREMDMAKDMDKGSKISSEGARSQLGQLLVRKEDFWMKP